MCMTINLYVRQKKLLSHVLRVEPEVLPEMYSMSLVEPTFSCLKSDMFRRIDAHVVLDFDWPTNVHSSCISIYKEDVGER